MINKLTLIGWAIGILLFLAIVVGTLWKLRRKFRKLAENIPEDLQGGDINGRKGKNNGKEKLKNTEDSEGDTETRSSEGGETGEAESLIEREPRVEGDSNSIPDADDFGEPTELESSRNESTNGNKTRSKRRKISIRRIRD